MPVTSKLDNELSQLLKAQITFKKNPETKGILSVKAQTGNLGDYLLEKYVKRGLEDINDIELTEVERLFLEKTGRISKPFLKYFEKHKYPKATIVKNKEGKIQEVKLEGSLVDLILIEHPLTAMLIEQQSMGQLALDSPDVNYQAESFRRYEIRMDHLRYNDVPIYLGGMKDRYSDEWFSVVVAALVGEFKDRIVGSNHLLTSMAFDVPSEAYLNDVMWVDDWDRRDIAPAMHVSGGWDGSRITVGQKFANEEEGFKYLIDGWDMASTMHFIHHAPGQDVIIELDKGIARDLGAKFQNLEITKKISK